MKTEKIIFFGLTLLLICSACISQKSDICLDSDQDGAYILTKVSELSDTDAETVFACDKPLDTELDCDDTNADIKPSVLEESETDSDLNCNGLIQGSSNPLPPQTCKETSGVDTDADGIANECDRDDDDDGVLDSDDNCVLTPNPVSIENEEQSDVDSDGVGDFCDEERDLDADGIGDEFDNCAGVANIGQDDRDNDGLGDLCDENPDVERSIVPMKPNETIELLKREPNIEPFSQPAQKSRESKFKAPEL